MIWQRGRFLGFVFAPWAFLDRCGHVRVRNDARSAYSIVLAEDGFRRDGFTGAFALISSHIEITVARPC